ncbi:ABI gene family member 3-like isoform X2 [Carassius carassius]|uniref:ABI gene family member 3-like isoform X2 n=1 Tax=Carassius carassius TaxID=217509 RepID=UPI0028691E08|nr:ABI gene family member 3-like isoform X2 [Carassius carassius]
MKDQNYSEEVTKILEEAPSARNVLLENYSNLYKVADYCESNYLQSGNDTTKALEETKAFTTQSLASVAYQISSMATNVLKLLDAQTLQLRKIESSINQIGQTVDMHREKVARREIGALTIVKRIPRSHKIVSPTKNKEATLKYSRTPISFSSLDSIGHGMKDSDQVQLKTATMTRSASIRSRGSRPPEPVQCPVAPTLSHGASLTSLNDKSIAKAVPPPVVPSWPTSPDVDNVSMLLEEGPPPPTPLMEEEGEQDHGQETGLPPPPPPPPLDCSNLPPPPPMVNTPEPSSPMTVPPPSPPSPLDCSNLPPPPPMVNTPELSNLMTVPPPSPPPPFDCSNLPPPPPMVNTPELSNLMTVPPPSPPPPLETVAEENGFPLPEDMPPPPVPDGLDLPTPPPPPCDGNIEAPHSRRSQVRCHPPSFCSLSLRVSMGPSARSRYMRSLCLPSAQSHKAPLLPETRLVNATSQILSSNILIPCTKNRFLFSHAYRSEDHLV